MKSLAFIILAGALAACGVSASTNQPSGSISIMVYQDPDTGCHYLHRYQGGITPRLDREGRQICTTFDRE